MPQWEAEFKDKSDLVQHKKKAWWLEKGTDVGESSTSTDKLYLEDPNSLEKLTRMLMWVTQFTQCA